MPDLSPDLSVYRSGLAGMGPGQLLSLVQSGRQLQTQQAVSDALRSTGGDPNAALTSLLQPGSPGFVNPETVEHLSRLGQYYTEQGASAIGSLYEKAISRAGANSDDFANTASILAGLHIPPAEIMELKRQAERPDGSLDAGALLRFWSYSHPGVPIPTVSTQLPSGVTGQVPATTAQFNALRGGGGFVPTNIPGAEAGGAAAPVVSSTQYGVAQKEAAEYQNDIQPLMKMHELATNLGPQGLGKSTELKTDLQNFLIASGGKKVLGADFDENKTYDYEELVKFTRRLADQVSAGGTDARLVQAVGGNPHVGMNQQPFLAVVRYLVAMRRMKQAQYSEYNATHTDPMTGQPNAGAFGPWSSEFLKQQDPRAYAFDLMGADNARALYSGLNKNPAAKARFEASRVLAEKHGLLEGGE